MLKQLFSNICVRNLVIYDVHVHVHQPIWTLCDSDVDVAEPDEKSLITYVSSLYDVFPDVPTVEQSLLDNVRMPIWSHSCLYMIFYLICILYLISLLQYGGIHVGSL